MALKDITLGQYFPGNSLLHRFDPRSKIIFTVFYIAAIFLCRWVVSYGLTLAVLLVFIAISKVKPKVFLKGMKPVVFIVIFTAILNLFYTTGNVLWSYGFLKITEEGLWKAGFMVLRILMLICCTLLLTYTTSPILLTDGLERLLRPLKRFGFPVHELSMMMSIALRFIPTLIQETDKIISAQKARGADFDSGNLIQKAKALVPILIPLFKLKPAVPAEVVLPFHPGLAVTTIVVVLPDSAVGGDRFQLRYLSGRMSVRVIDLQLLQPEEQTGQDFNLFTLPPVFAVRCPDHLV